MITLLILLLPTVTFPLFDTYRAQRAYEKKDYAKADALLNQRLTKDPNSAATHYNLGNSAYREKKFDVAQKHYEQAGKSAELRNNSLFNESNSLAFQGKYEDALKKIEEFLQTKPDDQKAQENREILKKLIEQKKKKEEEQKKKQEQEKKKKEEQDKKEKEQKEKSDKQDKQDQKDKSKKDQDEQKKEKEDKDQQEQQKKDKGEQEEKSEQDKQDQEQKSKQDEQKQKEDEQQGEGDRKKKEQKDQEGKGSEQEQPTPQEQAAKEADAKLHPELKRLLEAVESEDRKAAQKILKGQLKQQGGVSGQKNW